MKGTQIFKLNIVDGIEKKLKYLIKALYDYEDIYEFKLKRYNEKQGYFVVTMTNLKEKEQDINVNINTKTLELEIELPQKIFNKKFDLKNTKKEIEWFPW